ncbi:MAG: VCBS repeat-containing protein [Planctomycetaceae bacterium]|nr:VCBS repeat-containing protein [Planctomycetaceae bacterium]
MWYTAWLKSLISSQPTRRAQQRLIARSENLEVRTLLSNFLVTNLNDAGAGSLRDALAQSRDDINPDADVITFQSGLTGSISLATASPLQVQSDVTIIGPGESNLTITAPLSRLMDVTVLSTVAISGITFADVAWSSGNGGAIFNTGNLTLTNVTFSNNTVRNQGSALYNSGTAVLQNVTLDGNGQTDVGFDGPAGAGAIFNAAAATLEMHDSFVISNLGRSEGAIGGIDNRGMATITNTLFVGNESNTFGPGGGAISINTGATADIIGCSFINNDGGGDIAISPGGYAYISGAAFQNSLANRQGIVNMGEVEVVDSEFAFVPIGLQNHGSAIVESSLFQFVERGIVAQESPLLGASFVSTHISNSTFYQANDVAIYSEGSLSGGGSEFTVVNSTIASSNLGIRALGDGVIDAFMLFNSIVIDNATELDFGPFLTNTDIQANIIGDPASAAGLTSAGGNIVGATFFDVLEPLADNGGPTQTFALAADSPAANSGRNSLALDSLGDPLTADQRGMQRIVGGAVDRGAFESDVIPAVQPDDVVVFDPTSGRWRSGMVVGGEVVWTLGARWSPAGEWKTFTGDVNGDGLVDGIGINNLNQVRAAINDGTGRLIDTPVGGLDPTLTFMHVMVGDYDGNGTTDLVGMNQNGNWFSKQWNGTQFVTGFYGRYDPNQWHSFHTGDFNNDGVDDIIGFKNATGPERTGSVFFYGISNPIPGVGRRFSGRFAGGFGTTIEAGGWHDLTVGDFNGDGRDDIVAQQSTGRLWYATSTGGISGGNIGARFLELSAGARLLPTIWDNAFTVGDFNNDGLDDIVTIAGGDATAPYANSIVVGLSQPASTGPAILMMQASIWGNLGSGNGWVVKPLVGDFNGDGEDDLATFDTTSQEAYAAISDGTAFSLIVAVGPIPGEQISSLLEGGVGSLLPAM